MDASVRTFLDLFNETIATAIVVISASMLLYNIARNFKDRIARTSGIVLGCVTISYMSDVLITLEPGPGTFESLLRLQWVGLAFIPVAMFHLSDALLATTGLLSRGRRRRVIRILYIISTVFLIVASMTDILIDPVPIGTQISLRPGPIFPVYVAYFVIANGIAVYNVQRARQRCLTRATERRMAYLQLAILTPAIGIFPYSVLLGEGQEFSINALILVNIANLVVIAMLLFLSYPLSFFGSRVPDRVVKTELLRFILRGPCTALLALVVIVFTDPTSQVIGLPGETFMPFATVALILLWQWFINSSLPWIERRLIYNNENDQTYKLQKLSERYFSRYDLIQLLEAILEASCDYLRVNRSFIISLAENKLEMIQSIGDVDLPNIQTPEEIDHLKTLFASNDDNEVINLQTWEGYWLLPLYSQRINDTNNGNHHLLIGLMGIEARPDTNLLTDEERETVHIWVHRASRALDDLMLQIEIYAALEGLLPQVLITREDTIDIEYRPGRTRKTLTTPTLDRTQIIDQVQAALRHYWGGPGLTRSRLLELKVVRKYQHEQEITPMQALRDILNQVIEQLRPEGERNMKSPEWTLYNILHLRFLEKRKAKDTAKRLYISEANLYRKQNVAIESIVDIIIEMEQQLT